MQPVLNTKLSRLGKGGLAFLWENGAHMQTKEMLQRKLWLLIYLFF